MVSVFLCLDHVFNLMWWSFKNMHVLQESAVELPSLISSFNTPQT